MQLGGPSRFRGGLPTRSTARLFTDKQGKDEVPHFELRPYRDKGEQHVSGLLHYYDTAIDLKNKGCSSEAFLSSSCLSLADRCFCPLWNWHLNRNVTCLMFLSEEVSHPALLKKFCFVIVCTNGPKVLCVCLIIAKRVKRTEVQQQRCVWGSVCCCRCEQEVRMLTDRWADIRWL